MTKLSKLESIKNFAIKISEKSKATEQKHSAVIFDDKGNIISYGWSNPFCKNPLMKLLGYPEEKKIHAEFHALYRGRTKIFNKNNLSILSIRINNKGKLKMAKPCIYCESIIKRAGVRKIYYSDDFGNIVLF